MTSRNRFTDCQDGFHKLRKNTFTTMEEETLDIEKALMILEEAALLLAQINYKTKLEQSTHHK